ncbi:uncharacterized protein H6S33_001906 [Morchella sextelata]|uniref:uncharacterized protein n=1 Tax=Morchella sextelata TaxID=1174677 RepID=UPI001D0559AE|nr:uncharacterized protein H6S33_001906 [Morchella sextelata]KAH0607854.1 hypothetical protein H6S33_001906 [Morchella sextelata]
MSVVSGADSIQGVRDGYGNDDMFGPLRRACILRGQARDTAEKVQGMSRDIAAVKRRQGLTAGEILAKGAEWNKGARRWIQAAERYRLRDGLFYRLDEKDGDEGQLTLCIPKGDGVRVALFREAHDSLTGGHFGIDRTVKATNQKPMGLLKPLPVPNGRWERIGIDFICTIIDHGTRTAHFFPMKEATSAPEFTILFLGNHFRLHGIPKRIVSDRDVRFMSEFWRSFMGLLKTELSPSIPFHSQTDGATEKANQIVGTYLRAFATQYSNSWNQILPLAEFTYNSSTHKTTKQTPFFTDLGYTPTLPLDTVAEVKSQESLSARHLEGASFTERMHASLEVSRIALQNAQDQQSVTANASRHETTVKEGDSVFLNTKNLPLTYANVAVGSTKLRHLYAGPFTITKMINENAARLDIPQGLDIAKTQNNCKYRVRYVGFDESEDEWKSLRELEGSKETVENYHRLNKLGPPEWKKKKGVKDKSKTKTVRIKIEPGVGDDTTVRKSGRKRVKKLQFEGG